MPFILILEALAKAAIEFYIAKKAIDTLTDKKKGDNMPVLIIPTIEIITKVAITSYTIYKIGSKVYEEMNNEQ